MDTFRSGGNGGQNQNKRDTGVRFTHPPSGAVGESREARTQGENKKIAWRRMAESEKFKRWHKIEVARHMGVEAEIERNVEIAMRDENIKIEVHDERGKWRIAEPSELVGHRGTEG